MARRDEGLRAREGGQAARYDQGRAPLHHRARGAALVVWREVARGRVAQGDEGEGRVGDGSLEKWQCAGAGCWLWVAEVKDVMQAVGGILPQVHGNVDSDECKVLVVGVGREGKPVE